MSLVSIFKIRFFKSCQKCGYPISDTSTTCPNCNHELSPAPTAKQTMNCKSCGIPLEGNAKFCPSCGTPVAGASAPSRPRIQRSGMGTVLGGPVAGPTPSTRFCTLRPLAWEGEDVNGTRLWSGRFRVRASGPGIHKQRRKTRRCSDSYKTTGDRHSDHRRKGRAGKIQTAK